jgi:hypothetical protein
VLDSFGVALAIALTIDCACMNPPDQKNEKKEELAEEILRYLIDHPNAQDTLKGIVTWWLLERTIKHQTALVREALEKLVADGLVIAQQGSDSQTHYKINRQRRRKIISLLRH